MDHDELQRIAALLESCLRGIEGAASGIEDGAVAADPEVALHSLQASTDELRGLLQSLLGHLEGPTDLNRAIAEAVDALLRELEVPLVVHTRLQPDLPGIPWPREALQSTVRRALHLAACHAGIGGQVDLTTRREAERVLLEVQATGRGDARVRERGSTLQDFVAEMQGRCSLGLDDRGRLLLVLEFEAGAGVSEG